MSTKPDNQAWHLRAELRSHDEDVRSVCTFTGGLATGSRDKTIKLWEEQGPNSFSLKATLVGHTDYVSALAYFPPGPSSPLPDGAPALVSGSRDTTIGIWDVQSASMKRQLKGHQYQVAAVAIEPSSASIVSASLDKTARIWRGGECVHVLQGHEAAVLSVAVLSDGSEVSTGSGDCSIRVWSLKDGQCTGTLQAHTDSVRGLAALPGIGVVSASHDATLKVWTRAGECLAELVGHSALVYSTAASPDGDVIASGSEDGTARVWSIDGACLQTLEHPGCVWAVAFLDSGDLVTGCSDGVARVWSAAPERRASDEVVQALAAAIEARKTPGTGGGAAASGGDESSGGGLPQGLTLQDPSVLQGQGDRDGQVVVVKEGGSGVAYSWDAANATWERIGEVVAGPAAGNAGGKKWHQGKEWDYVFDVDVADGAPPLKLAMNADENPYLVADGFLEAYTLPSEFKEQIVEFILQNTGASGAGANAAGADTYVDPYTGAAAYVPPSAHNGTGPLGAGGIGAATGPVTGGGADPFTGASEAAKRHTPAKAFLVFDTPPPAEGIRKKLQEFGAPLRSQGDTSAQLLPENEEEDAAAVNDFIAAAASAPPRPFDLVAVRSVLPRLLSWPASQLFPCLDLVRILMLDPAGAAMLMGMAGQPSMEAEIGTLGRALAEACHAQPTTPASQQLAMRCACNCFAHTPLMQWARDHALSLLDLVDQCVNSASKGVRLGASTVCINLALALSRLPADEIDLKTRVLVLATNLLINCPVDDEEARYRALVALGTLLPEHSQIRVSARERGLSELLAQLESMHGDGKVKEAAREAAAALRL